MATTAQIDAIKLLEAATTDALRKTAVIAVTAAYPYDEVDPEDGVLKVVVGKTTYDIQAGNGNSATDSEGKLVTDGSVVGGDPYELLYAGKADSNI